jgi:restriction system protein
MSRSWVLRPYPHGIYRIKEFMANNIIAIGWPCIGSLASATTRAAIREKLLSYYKETNSQSTGQAVGNIARFVLEMNIDDLVVVPDGQVVYIGKIKSDYQYVKLYDSESDGYSHQRNVEWYYDKRAILRNMLTGRVHDSLKGRQTIFATYFDDIDNTIKSSGALFNEKPNFELKNDYLTRLQKGQLRNVNSNTFENAVRNLFANYFPGLRRLSTSNSKQGDTDLMAELPGDVVVRIQVKHFYPELGELREWVVKQLADSMDPGDHGIIITSGTISKLAYEKANLYQDRHISFIDGQTFTDCLFENIDQMDTESLWAFGLSRITNFL